MSSSLQFRDARKAICGILVALFIFSIPSQVIGQEFANEEQNSAGLSQSYYENYTIFENRISEQIGANLVGFDSLDIYNPLYSGPVNSSSGYTNSMIGRGLGQYQMYHSSFSFNSSGTGFFINYEPYFVNPTWQGVKPGYKPGWHWNTRSGSLRILTESGLEVAEDSFYIRSVNQGEAGFASYFYNLPRRNCTTAVDSEIQQSFWEDWHPGRPIWLLEDHPQGVPLSLLIDETDDSIIIVNLYRNGLNPELVDPDWNLSQGAQVNCTLEYDGVEYSIENNTLAFLRISKRGSEESIQFHQEIEVVENYGGIGHSVHIPSEWNPYPRYIDSFGQSQRYHLDSNQSRFFTLASQFCGPANKNYNDFFNVSVNDSVCYFIQSFDTAGQTHIIPFNITERINDGFWLESFDYSGDEICLGGSYIVSSKDDPAKLKWFVARVDLFSGRTNSFTIVEETYLSGLFSIDCDSEILVVGKGHVDNNRSYPGNSIALEPEAELLIIEDEKIILTKRLHPDLSKRDYSDPSWWDFEISNNGDIHLLNSIDVARNSNTEDRYFLISGTDGEILRYQERVEHTSRYTGMSDSGTYMERDKYNQDKLIRNIPWYQLKSGGSARLLGEYDGRVLLSVTEYFADTNYISFYGELYDNYPYANVGYIGGTFSFYSLDRNIHGGTLHGAVKVYDGLEYLGRIRTVDEATSETWFIEIEDSDHDGIRDNQDPCPDSNQTWETLQDLDRDGCHDETQDDDDDGDGIFDWEDQCPQGEIGWIPDSDNDADNDGCLDATEDSDDDADGIPDEDDECEDEPHSWEWSYQLDDDKNGCIDDDWAWWIIQEVPEIDNPTSSEEPIAGSTPVEEKPTTLAKLKQTISSPAGMAGIGAVSLVAIAGVSIAYASGHQPLQFKINRRTQSLGISVIIGGVKHGREKRGIEQRQKALSLIEENPGIHYSELRRLLNWGRGQLSHHIFILQSDRDIWLHPTGQLLLIFPSSVTKESIQGELLQLLIELGPLDREILAVIWQGINEPQEFGQAEISQFLGLNRRTASRHVLKMANLGVINLRTEASKNYFSITDLGVKVLTLGD